MESPELRAILLELISFIQDMINSVAQEKRPDIEESLRKPLPLSEVTSEIVDKTAEYAKGVATDIQEGRVRISQAKKEEINRRFDRLLSRMTKNPDVLRACHNLLNLLDTLIPKAEELTEEVRQKAEEVHVPEALRRAREDVLSLIAQFTGKEPLKVFLTHLQHIFNRIGKDRESSTFFYDLRQYIRKTLEDPTLIDNDFHQRQSEELWHRARALVNKWNAQLYFEGLLYEARYLILKITHDPVTSKLIDDLKALGKDLVLDSRGRPSLQVTGESIQQIRTLLVPIVLENLKEIPIPLIQGSTPKYDYKLENLIFSGYDVLPENVKVKMESDMDVNLTDLSTRKYPVSILTFKFKNIKVHLRDIKFDFYRKVVPRIHDKGIADIDISGSSTRIIVKWQVTFTEIGPVFSLLKARCHIKGLNINVKEAQHAWLYNFVTKLFSGTVKENMEKAIEDRIKFILLDTAKNLNELIRTPLSSESSLFGAKMEHRPAVASPLGSV